MTNFESVLGSLKINVNTIPLTTMLSRTTYNNVK